MTGQEHPDVDWVLLERIVRAIECSLPVPAVPGDARGAYALALLELGYTPNKAGAAVGVASRDLSHPIGASA